MRFEILNSVKLIEFNGIFVKKPPQLHLKFCYEAVLKHTEQVLQRHGIITSPCTRTPNNIALKVTTYFLLTFFF